MDILFALKTHQFLNSAINLVMVYVDNPAEILGFGSVLLLILSI